MLPVAFLGFFNFASRGCHPPSHTHKIPHHANCVPTWSVTHFPDPFSESDRRQGVFFPTTEGSPFPIVKYSISMAVRPHVPSFGDPSFARMTSVQVSTLSHGLHSGCINPIEFAGEEKEAYMLYLVIMHMLPAQIRSQLISPKTHALTLIV